MYKIALCDDLKSENVKLEEFINEYKLNNPTYDISITTFTSGYDVIDYIEIKILAEGFKELKQMKDVSTDFSACFRIIKKPKI